MNKLYIMLLSMIVIATSCEKIDQSPPNIANASSLDSYEGVLNIAYYYQHASTSPLLVMGDFRSDNALMMEAPFTDFDEFNPNLTSMSEQFFRPFYAALYKSILSTNNVIENSDDNTEIGEAKFLRALSYFKLVKVFGDVPVNLLATPVISDPSVLERQPVNEIYNNIIIPDLEDAIAALGTEIVDGRASKHAAQGMLGKVYIQMGNFSSAEPHLAAVVNNATADGIELQADFAKIFGVDNDLNSEIIFATQISSTVEDEYSDSEFWSWSGGLDTKSLEPLEMSLFNAYSDNDLRRAVSADTAKMASPKFPQTGGPDHDWIELRLADVILLYAEALNENGNTSSAVTELDKIRTRAGLTGSTASSQGDVRTAIQDERRLELAFEGQRWFDLVRTGTVDAAMGETVNSNYHLFPIPITEILSSFGVITQNEGY